MSLQTADFYVTPLPRLLIEKCRLMYDLYIETIQNESSSSSNATANMATTSNQKSPTQQDQTSSPSSPTKLPNSKNEEMLPSTLAKLLEDMGVPTTENDARALIFSLSQNAALQISSEESVQRQRIMKHQLQQQQQQDENNNNGNTNNNVKNSASSLGAPAAAAAAAAGKKKTVRALSVDRSNTSRRSSSTGANNNNNGQQLFAAGTNGPSPSLTTSPTTQISSAKLSLSFEMFLRVLQMPFNKSMRELEMQLLWSDLDRDKDGVLSKQDIAQSLARMNLICGKGIPRENSVENDQEGRKKEDAKNQHDDPNKAKNQSNGGDENKEVAGQHKKPSNTANNNKTALSRAFNKNQDGATKDNNATKSRSSSLMAKAGTTSTSQTQQQQQPQPQPVSRSVAVSASAAPTTVDEAFQSPWLLEELSEHQLEALIHQLDADGDGVVTFKDLSESLMNA